jgi:hypothetical protein
MFKQVVHENIFYTFLQWYIDHVGDYDSHSVTVADRYNYYELGTLNCIAYVYFYGGKEYLIRQDLYDKWNEFDGIK